MKLLRKTNLLLYFCKDNISEQKDVLSRAESWQLCSIPIPYSANILCGSSLRSETYTDDIEIPHRNGRIEREFGRPRERVRSFQIWPKSQASRIMLKLFDRQSMASIKAAVNSSSSRDIRILKTLLRRTSSVKSRSVMSDLGRWHAYYGRADSTQEFEQSRSVD